MKQSSDPSSRRRRCNVIGGLVVLFVHLLLSAALGRSISLDGDWEIAFDRDNAWKGDQGKIAHDALSQAWRVVDVPSVWELLEPDYDGVAWYRKRFDELIPDQEQRVRIRFRAVNYFAEVWLNNLSLGSHEGGYTPFEFEVTDQLARGESNELLLRVVDPGIHDRIDGLFLGGLDRFKKDLEIPQGKERRYGLNFGGIWQPVELIITGPVFLDDVFVIPHLNRANVDFGIQTDGTVADSTLEIDLGTDRDPGTSLGRRVDRVYVRNNDGTGFLETTMPVDQPHPWSPTDPFLYQARIRVYADGVLSDERLVRFGMREFTYREGAFHLNGKPILIKGGLTQGFYPITLAAPEYPEMVREEIRLAKEANLNLLRLHLKPHPPDIYRYADEMGILLYAEPSIGWMAESPELLPRCEREVREMILRDRNHPSVVIWGLLNEGSKAAGSLAMDLADLARSLDPSRIIIPDSGQSDTILIPFEETPVTGFLDRHESPRAPVDDAQFRSLSAAEGLVSETGYGGLFDLPRVLADYDVRGLRPDLLDYREYRRQLRVVEEGFRETGLGEVFESPRALLLATQMIEAEAARYQTDARRLSHNLDGIIHCFVANAWEYCGMLDVWRERKTCYSAVAKAFEPDHLIIWGEPRNGYLGEPLPIEIHFVTETPERGRASLSLRVEDVSGAVPWEKAAELDIERPIQRLLAVQPVITADQEGEFRLSARLTREGKPAVTAGYAFHLLRRDRNFSPAAAVGVTSSSSLREAPTKELGVELISVEPGAATPDVLVFTGQKPLHESLPFLPAVKEKGKTVVIFLDGTTNEMESAPLLENVTAEADLDWLRGLALQSSVGGSIGFYHYVRPRRVFQRLPQRCLMGQPYRNLCARKSLAGDLPPGSDVVVGAFTTTRGEFRWQHAADLAIIPYGSGRIVLCTLPVIPHLRRDSFADVLFLNLLRFAASG